MDENKKTPVKTEERDIPSTIIVAENVPPATFCTQAAQKILKIIQNQLVKDNLFNEEIIASLKKALPAVKKVALDMNSDCCKFVSKVIIEKTATTKKKLIDKEAQTKRNDHFTRFILNPYEKFLTNGPSQEVSAEKIPRKIIPVIKKAISLMVPAGYLERSQELSPEIVELYPDPDQTDGRDWEAICEDWRVVFEAMLPYAQKGIPIDLEEVNQSWEANFQDIARIKKLKKISELYLENNEIIKKLIEELTGSESGESDMAKLRDCVLEHVFNETGHEPQEEEAEKMVEDLITALSKPLTETL